MSNTHTEGSGHARAFRIASALPHTLARREFLRLASGIATGALAAPLVAGARRQIRVPSALNLSRLAPFVDPLPILPVATPVGPTPRAGLAHYRIPLREVHCQIHRDLPPTRFWSFGDSFPGPTVEVRRGERMTVDWINALPAQHFLPIDRSIHGAETDKPDSRAVVHVHGAKVRPEYDGHPDRWIAPGEHATYEYTNGQDATTLWYHDHTMGINRLNVYAGLMGLYLIRDAEEGALALPSGPHEIALLLCDRSFDTGAQLIYPVSNDPNKPWVPEVFGDALLVNGKLLPHVDVEPRAYRLRVVNGSNARFLRLALSDRSPFYCVGGDQGLLSDAATVVALPLAPAERADLVLDFSTRAGDVFTMNNDGQPAMQIRVARGNGAKPWQPPVRLRTIARLPESSAVKTRVHTLGEQRDMVQQPMQMLLNDTPWHMPVTEIVEIDSTEIWNLVNPTDDAHPIHLHLVRFQILDRRRFDQFLYMNERALRYLDPPEPPEPAEAGWKDTVRAYPGMATRIIVKFEGFVGRYMWHCHVLEHADNEMMRPFEVVARGAKTSAPAAMGHGGMQMGG